MTQLYQSLRSVTRDMTASARVTIDDIDNIPYGTIEYIRYQSVIEGVMLKAKYPNNKASEETIDTTASKQLLHYFPLKIPILSFLYTIPLLFLSHLRNAHFEYSQWSER